MASLDNHVARLQEILMAMGRRSSLRDPVRTVCEEAQLTGPQIHVVMWLGQGDLTMGELGRLIGVTEKTSTGIVDRLEKADYVKRIRDADDRRVVHVTLTRKGKTTSARLAKAMNAHLRQILALLDEADRLALFGILEKLLDRLPSRSTKESTASA